MATSVFPAGAAEPKDLHQLIFSPPPIPSPPPSPNQLVFTLSRPTSPPAKSHYRPVSTLLTPPPSAGFQPGFEASTAQSRRLTKKTSFSRPTSSIGLSFPSMGFIKSSKDKEKAERPSTSEGSSASRFFTLSLKKKRSLSSLAIFQGEDATAADVPAFPTTPPAPNSPHLEGLFDENSSPLNRLESSSSSSSSDLLSSASSVNPSEEKLVVLPPRNSDEDDSDDEYAYGRPVVDRYRPKDNWHVRRKLPLHPYGEDAPYMQAYDSVGLESDRYMHILLRRLNSRGSPSFLDLPTKPSSVLDLGCGQGHWLLDAAVHWPNAQIVGFDLVDIILPEVCERENIKFVRGNFVRYVLPFPPNTFDYIRISNLSMAIPSNRWNFVLYEAYRVLQVGGRVEVIDDDLVFPYGNELPSFRPKSVLSDQDESVDRELSVADRCLDQEVRDHDVDSSSELQEEKARRESFWDDEEDEATSEETDSSQSEMPSHFFPRADSDSSVSFQTEEQSLSESSPQSSVMQLDVDQSKDSAPTPVVASRTIRPLPAIPINVEVLETPDMTPTVSAFYEGDTPLTATVINTVTLPTPTAVHPSSPMTPELKNVVSVAAPTPNASSRSSEAFKSEWARNAANAHDLETVFVEMLATRFDIHPQGAQDVRTHLKKVFGKQNSMKVQSMHLKIAPPVLEDLVPQRRKNQHGMLFEEDEVVGTKEKKNHWMSIEWDKKEKPHKERKSSKKDKNAGLVAFPTMKDSTTRSRANTATSISEGRSSGDSVTTSNVVPEGVSAKAAGRLGITYNVLAGATQSAQASPVPTNASSVPGSSAASIHSNHSSGSSTLASSANVCRTSDDETRRDSSEPEPELEEEDDNLEIGLRVAPIQSPGLLLWPSTFIPMSADELEMHACKHMHLLLACKNAIAEWISSYKDEDGNAMVSEEALEDMMWEYECFRRLRLNWPSETPDTDMESHLQTPYQYSSNIEIPGALKSADSRISTFSTDSAMSWASEAPTGPFTKDSIVHVRTLRVYQGIKTRKPTRV